MSINGIHGTTPALPSASTAADNGPTAGAGPRSRTPAAGTEAPAAPTDDGSANRPAPLRFPWLSRLSTQLAAASKTPTTFAAPILGDNLDKQA